MKEVQILSYGAGVQTFGMLCLIKLGKLPKPELVIFADTQNERPETYKHIEEVAKPLMAELGLPFVAISRGNLYIDSIVKKHTPRPPICSKTYKVRVINAYLKEHYLTEKGDKAITWIGITTDEAHRAESKSDAGYIEKRFPLMELGMSRYMVKEAIKEAGYVVPTKSGCWFCPWRGQAEWLAMKQDDPERFKAALYLETSSGHKLPMYGTALAHLNQQTLIDWEGTTDTCDTGVCFV